MIRVQLHESNERVRMICVETSSMAPIICHVFNKSDVNITFRINIKFTISLCRLSLSTSVLTLSVIIESVLSRLRVLTSISFSPSLLP